VTFVCAVNENPRASDGDNLHFLKQNVGSIRCMTRNVRYIYCFMLPQKQGCALPLVRPHSSADVLSD